MKIVLMPSEIATVLVEALPYIRQFAGKSVVVKLGGAAIDKESDLALAQDVLLLRSVGVRCVLVHGGGPQVDAMLRRVGKEPEFRDGLRVTDAETLEIVRMVLVGKINRDLVATINGQAGDEPVAVGVSGEDAGLLTVTPADSSLGFSKYSATPLSCSMRGAGFSDAARIASKSAADRSRIDSRCLTSSSPCAPWSRRRDRSAVRSGVNGGPAHR